MRYKGTAFWGKKVPLLDFHLAPNVSQHIEHVTTILLSYTQVPISARAMLQLKAFHLTRGKVKTIDFHPVKPILVLTDKEETVEVSTISQVLHEFVPLTSPIHAQLEQVPLIHAPSPPFDPRYGTMKPVVK